MARLALLAAAHPESDRSGGVAVIRPDRLGDSRSLRAAEALIQTPDHVLCLLNDTWAVLSRSDPACWSW